MKSERLKEVKR